MSTLFVKYSPSIPITLSRPFETSSSRDNSGNLKILTFPNQWSSYSTSIATSGFISLAASSGIILNTPGYVDASGYRANSVYAQNYYRIDSTGAVTAFYSGSNGGIVYKYNDSTLGTVSDFVYNTGINKLTAPNFSIYKPLFISPGDNLSSPSKELAIYDPVEYVPERSVTTEVGTTVIPPKITIGAYTNFTGQVQIGPNYDGYTGSILTHMGADMPALWQPAQYLKADGVLWNRFVKHPVLVDTDRIIFYTAQPTWAVEGGAASVQSLSKEFDIEDTIALVNATTRQIVYTKLANTTTRSVQEHSPDTNAVVFSDLFSSISVIDPDGSDTAVGGLAVDICPKNPFDSGPVNAYAFSVKKGGYMSMQLEPEATDSWLCRPEDTGPFSFKPSTANNISIRPTISTSFNTVAENIDFVIYGKKTTTNDIYDSFLFDLNDSLIPYRIPPAFSVDAHIPNAVSGSPLSGVYFTKYLDREKTIPSGWGYDESARVTVNTYNSYIIDSIPSGTGRLATYANLTVSGVTYSDSIIAQDIYVRPKPNISGTGEYLANALLTVDYNGKIISRRPVKNPTPPASPSGISIVSEHLLNSGHDEISLEWIVPSGDGGKPITNYIVQFSANNGTEWTELPNGLTLSRGLNTQPSTTIRGLSLATPYIFRVAAQNSIGISDFSEQSQIFYSNRSVPEAPQNFVADRRFDDTEISEINLSWTDGNSGSSQIIGYVIEESSDGGNSWLYYNLPYENFITTTYETLVGTTAANNYLYRISAWNASGQSAYNFVYVSGNVSVENVDTEKEADVLGNWDFGKILFTGVCAL